MGILKLKAITTASTGGNSAPSALQIILAGVGAVSARVVAGRPSTGANAAVDYSTPLPLKSGSVTKAKE